MLMFRVLRHLLPSGLAWRATVDKALRRYLDGLSASYTDARAYVDDVYDDLFPSRTRWLERWERQFGLSGRGSTADRIANLQAAWQAQGGQSPRYIHDLLRTAGFDVCIHDWWTTDVSPRVPFDPRDVATQPVVGTVQFSDDVPTQPQFIAAVTATLDEPQPQFNDFLANYTKYLVNKTLRNVAPPPLPSSSALWPFFWYLSGSPHSRQVPAILDGAGRDTLERLALKVGPTHQWLVTNIDWAEPPAFLTEDGAHRWISRGLPEGDLDSWTSSKGDVVIADGSRNVVPRLFERVQGVEQISGSMEGDTETVTPELFEAFQESNPWSIAVFVRIESSFDSILVRMFGAGSERIEFLVDGTSGNVRISARDAAGNESLTQWGLHLTGEPFVLGDTHSIIATYDGAGTFTVYADGVELGSGSTGPHRTILALDELVLGGVDYADICLLNREIDATEAAAYGAYCDALYRPKSDVAGGVVERWRASVLADGPVSLWPGNKGAFDLDTPDAGTEPESSATLIDSTYRGVEFDDDDALDVAATGSLQTAVEGSFSLAWLGHASEGPSEKQVIFCDHSVDPSSVEIRLFEGDLEFFRREDGITGGSGFVSGGPDDSGLHSWVATYDNSTGRFSFFVDGLKIGEDTNGSSPGLAISIDRFIVGNAPSATRPFGALADVTVFDSALSDDDAESVGKWLMWLYSSCAITPEPAPLLLDKVSNEFLRGGYSVARKLRVGYAGPLFQAQRTSGQTQDIHAAASGEVDLASLEAFADGEDVRVITLYDQGWEGRDYTAANDGPKVYDATSGPVLKNGKLSTEFAAPDEMTRSDALGLSGNVGLDVFTVGRSDPGFLWQLGPSNAGERTVLHVVDSDTLRVNYADGNQDFEIIGSDPTVDLLAHHIRSPALASYNDNRWWVNDSELASVGSVDGTLNMIDTLSFVGNGPSSISEWLVFGTPTGNALSETDAELIRADQTAFYAPPPEGGMGDFEFLLIG